MGKSAGKCISFIATGTLLTSLAVVERREPFHIEQRQYEKPAELTIENAYATPTVKILSDLFGSDLAVVGGKRVILVSIPESQPVLKSIAVEEKMSVQAIQARLQVLKDSASQLDKTILENAAKDALLGRASDLLSDVETLLLPYALKASNPAHAAMWFEIAEFQLGQAEQRLKYAQAMIVKYGANLQAVGA
jgi:hypothetical protein